MIRRFQGDDLTDVMKIWRQGNRDAHYFIPASFWDEHFAEVSDAILEAEVYVFDDNGVDGFIGLQGDYIAGLFTAPDKRGRGIGSALIDFVKNGRCFSVHVFEKNIGAVRFYQRHGFSLVERVKNPDVDEWELCMKSKADSSIISER